MKIMKLLKQILSITLIAVSMIVFISGCFLNSVVDRVINNIEALDAFECYSSENHEVFISKYNKPFGGISKFGRISKNNEDAFCDDKAFPCRKGRKGRRWCFPKCLRFVPV